MRRSLFVLACCVALVACGGGGGEAEVSGSTGRHFLSVGTAPQGGAFFAVGGAIAETLNDHAGDNGWDVTAEATKGSQENIRRLDSGELDMALSNSAITYFAVRGAEEWDRAYDVKTMMTLAPNVALFIAPKRSGIDSIDGLRGKRVVVGPAGAGFQFFIRPILAAHGVTYDDFSPQNAGQGDAVNMLSDGTVAAAFLGGAVPTPSIVQAATSQEINYIRFDEAARARLVEEYVFFRPATITAGTYRGLETDYEGLDVGSMHLIVSGSADEESVYQLTKAVYENAESVTQRHPAGRAINGRNVVRNTGTEFHPGAIRFYREIGIWPEDEAGD